MTRDVLLFQDEPASPRTEAADWMALERSGRMSDEERRAFQHWRDLAANAAAWRDVERAWHGTTALRTIRRSWPCANCGGVSSIGPVGFDVSSSWRRV